MKKIKILFVGFPMFIFLMSCEPEDILSESSQQEIAPTEIYSDTGEDGGPIDDKRD